VFENLAAAGPAKSPSFIFSAITHTDLLVQIVLLAFVAAFFSLLRDLFRTAPSRLFA
jgi:hypothetical protein